jgi:hypothetical protein
MFSNVKSPALVHYVFDEIPVEDQAWFISQFGSLEHFLPLDCCLDDDLDRKTEYL